MNNFFSSKLKYKAFLQALKEVEDEGFFVDDTVDETSMPMLPDRGKALASLSGKTKENKEGEETIDIKPLVKPLETDLEEVKKSNPVKPASTTVPKTPYKTRSQYYDNLFSKAPSFLDEDVEVENPELLPAGSRRPSSQELSIQQKVDRIKQRVFDKINNKNQEGSATVVVKAVPVEEPKPVQVEEKVEIKPEPKPVEIVEQKKETPKQPKLIVEVVADVPKVVKKKKTTVKKPRTTTKKKRRKYDADIAGGFDF